MRPPALLPCSCLLVALIAGSSPAAAGPACEGDTVTFCGESLPTNTASVRCYEGRGSGRPQFDLSPLRCLPDLESVALVSGELEFIQRLELDSVEALAELSELRIVELGHTTLEDLSPLAKLPHLEELSVHAGRVADIAPLSSIETLLELDLSCTKVGDVTPLAGLESLRVLDLTNTPVADISSLASLTSLERLGLSQKQQAQLADQLAELKRQLPQLVVYEGRTY